MGSSTERGDDAREDAATTGAGHVPDEVGSPSEAAVTDASDAVNQSEPTADGDDHAAAEAVGGAEVVGEPAPDTATGPDLAAEPEPEPEPARRVEHQPAPFDRPVADGTVTAVMRPTAELSPTSPTRTPLLDAVAAAGVVNVPTSTPPESPIVPAPVVPREAVTPSVAVPPAPVTERPVASAPPVTVVPAPPLAPPALPVPTSPPVPGQVVRVPGIPGRQVPAAAAPSAAAAPTAAAPAAAAAPLPASGPVQASTGTFAPIGHAEPAVASAQAPAPAPVSSASRSGDFSPFPTRDTQVLDEPSSPLDVFEADSGRRRWPRVLVWILSIAIVLGAVYVGTCYAVASKVPRGATVAGVDIGGLDRAAAIAALQSGLTSATTEPIAVTAGDITGTVDPASAGLRLDAAATVSRLVGFDLHPVRLWNLLFGIGLQEPVTHVDEAALASAVETLGGSLTQAPVDGAIVFADGTPHETAAAEGWKLDAAAAAQTLRTQWLTAARPLTLTTVAIEPDITQAETDKTMTEVATRVTSAPVAVNVGGQLVSLPVKTLASVASFAAQDSGLALQLDGTKLVKEVLARTTNLLTASADAHFEFQNDAPVIVPGQAGTTLDPKGLADAVAAAAVARDRTATVALVQTDPAQSTDKLTALGIKEIVAEFATPLTSEPKRTANITNGATNISGTLVLPDGTFSLTEALGPVTAENGYINAGVLVAGEHVQGMGGGLSQVSTTTFNAAYLAGYVDVEHHPHTEWFSRYPEGREATIYTGTLDMRWQNNTPYGALVQAWVANNQVHVRIWSTKYWTVETSTSARSNVKQPTTVYSQSPTCVPSSAGNPGFRVTTTRTVSLDGAVKETKAFTWTYTPQNTIICGPAPTAPATPAG
ncbi:MAG: VanW family protein [Cellulomonas sp.]